MLYSEVKHFINNLEIRVDERADCIIALSDAIIKIEAELTSNIMELTEPKTLEENASTPHVIHTHEHTEACITKNNSIINMLLAYVNGILFGTFFILSAFGDDIPDIGKYSDDIRRAAASINGLNNVVSYDNYLYLMATLIIAIYISGYKYKLLVPYSRGFFVGAVFLPCVVGVLASVAGGIWFVHFCVIFAAKYIAIIILSILYYPFMFVGWIMYYPRKLVLYVISILVDIIKYV